MKRTQRNGVRALGLVWISTTLMFGQDVADTGAPGKIEQVTRADAGKTVVRNARLAWFSGDLQVQRADNTGGDAAALNMPLSEGTRLMAGDDARAEIEFEDGSVARLTAGTVLVLDTLGVGTPAGETGPVTQTQISVLSGTAYLELRATTTATWNVYAGGVAASPTANTTLRVSLADPPVIFAVLSGAVSTRSAEAGGFTANVRAGESLRPDVDDATRYFLNQEVAENNWDDWNRTRDQAAGESASSRTVARDAYATSQGYGWSDLDANGTWYNAPNAEGGTDELWQPATADAESFDPYGDGAWVYSGGAYVWASGYTWGWLPYHCGRWLWVDGLGWVWRPSRFCGTIGFGGDAGGGYLIDDRRHRHRPVERPIPKPGGFHPILRIHNPTAPPVKNNPIYATPMKLATGVATPLLPISVSGGGGTHEPASALSSDFVIDSQSRRPVMGSVARPVAATSGQGAGGWVPRQSGSQSGAQSGAQAGSELRTRPAATAAPGSPSPAAPVSAHHEQAPAAPTRTQAAAPPAPAPHAAAPQPPAAAAPATSKPK